MAMKTLPSPEELHKYLSYDPATGELTWLARTPDMFDGNAGICGTWNTRWSEKPALHGIDKHGYRAGRLNSKKAYAHRVAYALMTGAWPGRDIDHISGDRSDNRWSNLRSVSRAENMKNVALLSSNTSGSCGVCWNSRKGKWLAQIVSDGRQVCLGFFSSKDDAITARKQANIKYGFTERHGT